MYILPPGGTKAIQIATGMQLLPCDYVSYILSRRQPFAFHGFLPFRANASNCWQKKKIPSLEDALIIATSSRDNTKAKIIHQSSATGMQAIPTTGLPGLTVLEQNNYPQLQKGVSGELPLLFAAWAIIDVTEGEGERSSFNCCIKTITVIF